MDHPEDTTGHEEIHSAHEQDDEQAGDVDRPRHVRRSHGRHDEAATPQEERPGELEHRAWSLDEHREEPPDGHAAGGRGIAYQPPLTPELEISTYSETTDGAIPPPTMLMGYREVDPSYPDMIMAMAKADADSRVRMRDRITFAETFGVIVGTLVAAVLPTLGLVLAFVALMMGKDWQAILVFVPSAAAAAAQLIRAVHGRRESD